MLRGFWTVLVVEDDEPTREGLSEALLAAGLGVLPARNLSAARNVLRTFPGRALIVLDLDLPDGRGEELLEYLRTLPSAAARFPVVISSAATDATSLAKMPFVVDVLTKPIAVRELSRRILEHAQLWTTS